MSYGLQVFDGGGNIRFDSDALVIRITKSVQKNAGDSGSFTVAKFDENKGVIFIEGSLFDQEGNISYSWDNSSKTLTYDLSDMDSGSIIFMFYSFK